MDRQLYGVSLAPSRSLDTSSHRPPTSGLHTPINGARHEPLRALPILEPREHPWHPRFNGREEAAGTVAGRVAPAAFGLAIPAIALVWFALAQLARFPVVG